MRLIPYALLTLETDSRQTFGYYSTPFCAAKEELQQDLQQSLKQLRLPVCHIDGVSLYSTPMLQGDSSIWISVYFDFRCK